MGLSQRVQEAKRYRALWGSVGTGPAPAAGTVTGSDTDSQLSGPQDPALQFCLLTLGDFLPVSPYLI